MHDHGIEHPDFDPDPQNHESSLSLDPEVIDAQLAEPRATAPADPWLARRLRSFGASDVPIVLVALGRRRGFDVPRWMEQRARPIRPWNAPRIFCEKAGLVDALAAGTAAAIGSRREEELLGQWRIRLMRGQYDGAHEELLEPSTLRLARDVPREWFPLVCRDQPVLAATPDAWMRDALGELVNIEAKCVRGEARELRWYWREQTTAQRMATGSAYTVAVAGERWAHEREENGPIRSFLVPPLEALEREIDEAIDEAWATVLGLKARRAA
jgi:hypothetical protein